MNARINALWAEYKVERSNQSVLRCERRLLPVRSEVLEEIGKMKEKNLAVELLKNS